jgi:hypothetical protein
MFIGPTAKEDIREAILEFHIFHDEISLVYDSFAFLRRHAWNNPRHWSTNTAVESGSLLFVIAKKRSAISAAWHHLEQNTSEIFGLWNRRHYRMIECLFEATQPARGSPRVDERIRDGLVENGFAHMIRAGKCRKQSIF